MKVLIETITSRRGYKNFADEAEFDDFLAQTTTKSPVIKFYRKMMILLFVAIYRILSGTVKV